MELHIHSDVLRSLARRISGAIRKKDDPRFGRIFLYTMNDSACIGAGDLEYFTVVNTRKAQVIEHGAVVVSAEKFLAISGGTLNGMICIKAKESMVSMQQGRSRYRLPILGQCGLENLPTIEWKISISAHGFLQQLKRCTSIASNDYYPFIEIHDGRLSVTDNTKAAVFQFSSNPVERIHLSNRGAEQLVTSLRGIDVNEVLHFGWDEAWLGACVTDQWFWIRFVGGEFPNIASFFSGQPQTSFRVEAELLKDALGRVSAIGKEDVVLTLKVQNGLIGLQAADYEGGMASDAIEADTEGEMVCRCLLSDFLTSVTLAGAEKRVIVSITDRVILFYGHQAAVALARMI